MKYGREYARRPSGSGSGLLLILILSAALVIGYGESAALVELRQTIADLWDGFAYEEALETLGRSFVGENGEPGVVMVFSQQILGFGE